MNAPTRPRRHTTSDSRKSREATPAIYSDIGLRIRTRRYDCGLSQAQLAERIGQNRCSLTQIELGKQKVAVHELIAIAQVLGVPVHCLLPEQEDHP